MRHAFWRSHYGMHDSSLSEQFTYLFIRGLDYFISFFYPFSSVTSYALVTSPNSNFNRHRSNYLYSWLPTRSSRGVVVIEFASNPVFGLHDDVRILDVYLTTILFKAIHHELSTCFTVHFCGMGVRVSCSSSSLLNILQCQNSSNFFRNDHRL